MTLEATFALFVTLLLLALVPGVSSLLVAARSAGGGFAQGAVTTAGIVVGDLVFLLVAIYGWNFINRNLTGVLPLVKYLAGIYLVWLGVHLWRARKPLSGADDRGDGSLFSGFLAGLLITLGDQKAVWFYLGLLPAFVDMRRISFMDAGSVILAMVLAVGCAKLGYAFLGDRAGHLLRESTQKAIHRLAGVVLIGLGVLVAVAG